MAKPQSISELIAHHFDARCCELTEEVRRMRAELLANTEESSELAETVTLATEAPRRFAARKELS
jgi:hypothetical protein